VDLVDFNEIPAKFYII